MARPLRIEYAGALYHVTSRGDRREEIYLDDEDRLLWLEVFGSVCDRFNWRCHAWVLMDNHYHIVIETVDGNLSKGMRQLNGVYTQKHNRKHRRVGHVFQGRFKGILVDKESYLLELSRYVVLNPLRARMVKQLSHWKWSSYRAMIGMATPAEWLETDWILAHFGRQRKTAVTKYIEFVREGKRLESVWDNKIHPTMLGDEVYIESIFKEHVGDCTADVKEINRLERKPTSESIDYYFESECSERDGMIEAYKSGDFTMKAIADHRGVHYSTVSRILSKLEEV